MGHFPTCTNSIKDPLLQDISVMHLDVEIKEVKMREGDASDANVIVKLLS